MRGFLRKLFLAILAVGALAALAYHSRHKIHLGDFTWSRFAHAVGQANLWLLLLSVVAIYVCFALRTLRWQRLSRYLGPTGFVDVYNATVMGFASIFILGRAGEPVRPLLTGTQEQYAGRQYVWSLGAGTDHRLCCGGGLGGTQPACVHRPAGRCRGRTRIGFTVHEPADGSCWALWRLSWSS